MRKRIVIAAIILLSTAIFASCNNKSGKNASDQYEGNPYIYYNNEDTWIQDDKGNKIVSYKDGDFDYILGYGDEYFVLGKDNSGYDGIDFQIGIIDLEGKWAFEYETASYFLSIYVDGKRIAPTESLDKQLIDPSRIIEDPLFHYKGCGVFEYKMVDSVHLSCRTGKMTIFDRPIMFSSEYVDGYSYVVLALPIATDRRTLIMDTYGIYKDLGEEIENIYEYSDGGFICKYYENHEECLGFYDIKADTYQIIFEDVDRIINDKTDFRFINGEFELALEGADGKTYYAKIDKAGNYIEEPHL